MKTWLKKWLQESRENYRWERVTLRRLAHTLKQDGKVVIRSLDGDPSLGLPSQGVLVRFKLRVYDKLCIYLLDLYEEGSRAKWPSEYEWFEFYHVMDTRFAYPTPLPVILFEGTGFTGLTDLDVRNAVQGFLARSGAEPEVELWDPETFFEVIKPTEEKP